MVLRPAKHREQKIPLDPVGINVWLDLFHGEVVQDRELHHPAAQVLPHGGVSDARIQVAGLKFLHFAEALHGRLRPNSVKQLINIHVGEGRRDPAEVPSAHQRSPGKISPELVQVQIMIGRKIAHEFTAPGRVVLVILHELTLPAEVPALVLKRTAPVLIELHHLENAGRDLAGQRAHILLSVGKQARISERRGHISPAAARQPVRALRRLPALFRRFQALLLSLPALFLFCHPAPVIIAAHGFQIEQSILVCFAAGICPSAVSGIATAVVPDIPAPGFPTLHRIVEHDGKPSLLAGLDRPVEQLKDDRRFRPAIK